MALQEAERARKDRESSSSTTISSNLAPGGDEVSDRQQLQRRRYLLLNSLRHTQGGLCRTLARTVTVGVAYHHAGLMADQRKIVEEGFSSGVLNLIVAK